jgi:hypothetical protein
LFFLNNLNTLGRSVDLFPQHGTFYTIECRWYKM